MVPGDLAWRSKSHRADQQHQLAAEVERVVGDPHALLLGVEPRLQPGRVRGDAGRAAVGVAGHGLDAAHREHEAAGDVDGVRAQRQREADFRGRREAARRDQADPLPHAALPQEIVQPRQRLADGRAHVVGQPRRRRARPALRAVEDDVVGALALGQRGDLLDQVPGEAAIAQAELHAHGLAAQLLEVPDEGKHRAEVVKLLEAVRRVAVLVHRDVADARDLGGDLRLGQDAAAAGLGALRELDRRRAKLRRQLLVALRREGAVQLAHAEQAGAHLEDAVARRRQMIGRKAAFSRREPGPRERGAAGQRRHRRAAQRAEAHVADVGVLPRLEGKLAGRTEERRQRRVGGRFALQRGEARVHEVPGARGLQVEVGPEAQRRRQVFRRSIHPLALAQVEGPRRPRAFDEVLLDLLPLRFKDVADPGGHRKVVPERVLLLQHVPGGDAEQEEARAAEQVEEEVAAGDGGWLGEVEVHAASLRPARGRGPDGAPPDGRWLVGVDPDVRRVAGDDSVRHHHRHHVVAGLVERDGRQRRGGGIDRRRAPGR